MNEARKKLVLKYLRMLYQEAYVTTEHPHQDVLDVVRTMADIQLCLVSGNIAREALGFQLGSADKWWKGNPVLG